MRAAAGIANCMSATSLTMRAPDGWRRPGRRRARMGKRTSTEVPLPFSLLILSSPPCSCTSARAMGSPRPVPSRQRAWLASTWPKGVNATETSSGVMPTPVSRTVASRISPRASALTSTVPPSRVNFRALEMRLVNTWRRRTPSPLMCGRSGSMLSSSSTPAFSAMSRNEEADALSTSPRFTSRGSMMHLPLWILEMSRMLLMTASRWPAAS